ncbi:MAG: hypothetical protein GY953_09070 [bacterium]|nr:hypothetical protein [bacterium]
MSVFIHGNHEGYNRRNESYTICRIDVPRKLLVEEIRRGYHPFHVVETVGGKEYPRLKDDRLADPPKIACTACLAIGNEKFATPEPDKIPTYASPLQSDEERMVRQDEEEDTYFTCRLGVRRPDAVNEALAGWYPGYHRLRVGGMDYLRNNPNFENPDNVNSTWQCPWV